MQAYSSVVSKILKPLTLAFTMLFMVIGISANSYAVMTVTKQSIQSATGNSVRVQLPNRAWIVLVSPTGQNPTQLRAGSVVFSPNTQRCYRITSVRTVGGNTMLRDRTLAARTTQVLCFRKFAVAQQ